MTYPVLGIDLISEVGVYFLLKEVPEQPLKAGLMKAVWGLLSIGLLSRSCALGEPLWPSIQAKAINKWPRY